jgi:hypothetical protein
MFEFAENCLACKKLGGWPGTVQVDSNESSVRWPLSRGIAFLTPRDFHNSAIASQRLIGCVADSVLGSGPLAGSTPLHNRDRDSHLRPALATGPRTGVPGSRCLSEAGVHIQGTPKSSLVLRESDFNVSLRTSRRVTRRHSMRCRSAESAARARRNRTAARHTKPAGWPPCLRPRTASCSAHADAWCLRWPLPELRQELRLRKRHAHSIDASSV